MDKLSMAIEIATMMHRGQTDKGGNSYILHPLRVMMKMTTENEMIVGVLHDVLEDSPYSLFDLSQTFGDEIANAVRILTRDAGLSYMDFVRRCKQNELARKVKMADIEDNMDLGRIPEPSKEDYKRVEKYEKAWRELSL